MEERELLLALARDPEWRLVTEAAKDSAAVAKATAKLAIAAYKAWAKAGRAASKALKSLAAKGEPALRDDVLEVLTEAYTQAATSARDALDEAWDKGREMGVKQANAMLATLGLPAQDPVIDETVYLALRADVTRNLESIRERFDAALGEGPEALKKVRDDLARRAQYSVDVAGKRSATEAKIAVFRDAGVQKMWVSRLIPGVTCSNCAALHGQVADWDEDFVLAAKVKLYYGLPGPPLHPNCMCVLVPYVSQGKNSRARNVGIREMMDQGLNPPAEMTVGDLLAMPNNLRKKFQHWLVARITGEPIH